MGKPVDQRSDMFSAGAVFYEFLTRQKPFKGKTLHGVLYQIVSEDPDPVLTVVPEVPARVAAVVHGMLRKEPEKRFASMDEVGRTLRALHASLRRSSSRSALPRVGAPAAAKDARGRLRDNLSRGRSMLEEGQYGRVLTEMDEALALEPESEEAFELAWRARRKQDDGRREADRPDPANEKRVVALLAKMKPGAPDAEARGALAELALIAPDDPRVNHLLRERAGRDR